MRLLTWDEAQRSVGWDALLMIGGVTSLGAASVKTGLAKWMVDAVLGGMAGWSPAAVVAAISAFTVVVHLAIPIAPVINSVLIPPIVLLAVAAGQSPALYALPVAFTASCAFLLPLDAVPLITFARGYYRTLDMLAPGAVISLVVGGLDDGADDAAGARAGPVLKVCPPQGTAGQPRGGAGPPHVSSSAA